MSTDKRTMARLGDVWYQVMDSRDGENETEYKLYSKDDWIPSTWIKEFKDEWV